MKAASAWLLLSTVVLAGCNSVSTTDGAAVSATGGPASTVPGAPTGQTLAGRIAGNSLSGEAISGEAFCTYYAADGSLTGRIGGAAESGTWAVEGAALCETKGGVTGCSRVDILPTGQVTMTSLEGSGSFQTSATMTAGNQCGA